MPPNTLTGTLQDLQSRYQSFQAQVALERQTVNGRQRRLQEHNDHLVAKIEILQEENKGLRNIIEVDFIHSLLQLMTDCFICAVNETDGD